MFGNYLQLRQPHVGEMVFFLEKNRMSPLYSNEFEEQLKARDSKDSLKWVLNRLENLSELGTLSLAYLDNSKGARFEIQSPLNGMPDDLGLRLLANKEIPADFCLFGSIVMPSNLNELYELKNQNKTKIMINQGKRNWVYPISGIIKKIEDNKYFLEFH